MLTMEMDEFKNAFIDAMNTGTKELAVGPNNDNTNETKFKDQYQLSAVVTHQGNKSTEVGHYIADVFR
jgi:hypothetical protein